MASSRRTIKVNPLDEVRQSPEPAEVSKPALRSKRSARAVKPTASDDGVEITTPASKPTQPDAAQAPHVARAHAERVKTLGLRAPDGGRAFVRYVHESGVSDGEVLLDIKTRDVGFVDTKGDFVSLMHLKGPVISGASLKSFGPMALVASMLTGAVGCAIASLMKGRSRFLFRLGQFPNQGKYVSIDENALNILKSVIGRWDAKARHARPAK